MNFEQQQKDVANWGTYGGTPGARSSPNLPSLFLNLSSSSPLSDIITTNVFPDQQPTLKQQQPSPILTTNVDLIKMITLYSTEIQLLKTYITQLKKRVEHLMILHELGVKWNQSQQETLRLKTLYFAEIEKNKNQNK